MHPTAVPADARRAPVIAASRAGDPYTFLDTAERYLRDAPDDHQVLALAVRAYVGLGLPSAGRRLLQRPAVAAELRAKLAPLVPNAEHRVPWSRLDPQFQANLALFDQRTGLADAVRDVWRGARHKLQLLVDVHGGYQLFSRLPDAPGWLPAFAPHNHLSDIDELRAKWSGRVIAPLAISGVGLGYVVRDVTQASRHTLLSYSAPVVIIEPSLLAWAVVLHLFDWRDVLAEERVSLCIGPDALPMLEEVVRDIERPVPRLLAVSRPWPGSCGEREVHDRLEAARARRGAAQRALHARASAYYAERDAAWWAGRFANAGKSEPPLNILAVTSRFTTVLQYSMRDWLAAFERLGHRTRLYIQPNDHAHMSPIRVLRQIEQDHPDLLLLIDHLQYEYVDVYPPGMPGICWIQDTLPHLFKPRAGRSVRPFEFVIGQGFPETLTRFAYPAERFYPCLIPTNPHEMLDPHERPVDLDPYRCDLMFATNASIPPEEQYRQRRQLLTGPATRLFDAACEMLTAVVRQPWFCGDYDYAGLLARAEADTKLRTTTDAIRSHILATLHSIADISLRERTVRAAARWATETGGTFHLYGNGWEQREEFARFARGFVPHGRTLARAFRGARICLHAGRNSALHQRVLDGLCAGGFFLIAEKPSDALPDVPQAVDRYITQQSPTLPFWLKPEMLPQPYADRCRRSMQMRGVDPAVGTLITAEHAEFLKCCRELRAIPAVTAIWPRYEQVVYRDDEHFAQRVNYFLAHADERRELAREMRAAVLEHFTYDALVRDLLRFMWQGLARVGNSTRA